MNKCGIMQSDKDKCFFYSYKNEEAEPMGKELPEVIMENGIVYHLAEDASMSRFSTNKNEKFTS